MTRPPSRREGAFAPVYRGHRGSVIECLSLATLPACELNTDTCPVPPRPPSGSEGTRRTRSCLTLPRVGPASPPDSSVGEPVGK